MWRTKTKIFVSNKGVMLEEKINNELDHLEEAGCYIKEVSTDISFSGATGYQAMGTIIYEEYIHDEVLVDDSSAVFFNSGEFISHLENDKGPRSDAH